MQAHRSWTFVLVLLFLLSSLPLDAASEVGYRPATSLPASDRLAARQTITVVTDCPEISPALPAQLIYLPLVMRNAANTMAEVVVVRPQALPPDPNLVAPPLDRSVATDIFKATAFLYSGDNPTQTGVAPGTIGAQCVTVLRGKALATDGSNLPGVAVTIVHHPEYGQTLSRNDGLFDMAINGGASLTLAFAKPGYLQVQRTIETIRRDYLIVDPVVMTARDTQVTRIDLASTADFQIARGSVVSDTDGPRQATLLFPRGTGAVIQYTNGTTRTLGTISVRATEFTVGDLGLAAMPGDLPPTSGYTYAVELSVDEADASGAAEVRFDKPVINYTENLIGAPVGSPVPVGYYDRAQGNWIPSKNGRVLKVLGETASLADLDVTGDGAADTGAALAALGITDAERGRLAALYDPGQELWRVEINHFSSWDMNWPFSLTPGAEAPRLDWLDTEVTNPCQTGGSIIGCETQTLGEDMPVVGTPFGLIYRNDRVPGWKAGRVLDIPVTGPQLPPLLKGVQLQVDISGQRVQQRWEDPNKPLSHGGPLPPLQPNITYHFEWDGLDAYGRPVQGRPVATITVRYVYDWNYNGVSDASNASASFGQFGDNVKITDGRGACGVVSLDMISFFCGISIWKTVYRSLGPWDVKPIDGLGGWTLDVHHAYDIAEQTLHKGDGTVVRSKQLDPILTTLAGGFDWGGAKPFPEAEGGPARDAIIDYLGDFAVGPDGSIYLHQDMNYNHIRKVDPAGIITTFAGNGLKGDPTGDGGPALSATLGNSVNALAAGPDGSVYLAVSSLNQWPAGFIRKIDRQGIITRIAGNGNRNGNGDIGDGGPAVDAKVSDPIDVVVGPDGSIYFGERAVATNGYKARIRKIDPSGIVHTIAGGGNDATRDEDLGDGEPATQHDIKLPYGLAFGPDGSLYIPDPTEHVVKRVTPDGIIHRFAGNHARENSGDGGPPIQAGIADPVNVAVANDGTVYIRSSYFGDDKVRKVSTGGSITTYAGQESFLRCGYTPSTDGVRARQSCIWSESRGMEIHPDGSLLVGDGRHRVRKIAMLLTGSSGSDLVVPSDDGSELYDFDGSGRHLRTLDALTGAELYRFSYDAAGRLSAVTDAYNNITRIERDANGTPVAIVAPLGQRTTLAVNPDGYLSSIANPAGETTGLAYAQGGLLASLTDPRGSVYAFAYDVDGRLTRDEGPSGEVKTLARVTSSDALTVTVRTALGRETEYVSRILPTGDRLRTVRQPGGELASSLVRSDGLDVMTAPDGTLMALVSGPDPRWGLRAPIVESLVITTPNGLRLEATTQRIVTLADPKDLMSLQSLVDRITINGQQATAEYDAAARTITSISPKGRQNITTLNARGRVTAIQNGNLLPVTLSYDTRGRLSSFASGTRVTALGYDNSGYPATATDAIGRVTSFAFSPAGLITQKTLPGGAAIAYTYDAAGNLTSLTPPGRPAHTFDYTPSGLVSRYAPPDVNPGSDDTLTSYSPDEQPTLVTRPDGQTIAWGYDSAGRPNALTVERGILGIGYDATTGNLASVNAPGGSALAYTYDGSLLEGTTLSGPVAGTTAYTYDSNLRLVSSDVNAMGPIAYQYDDDSLLIQSGALALHRDAQNGLLTGSTLGSIADAITYSSFGETTGYHAAYAATPLLDEQYERDQLGRIASRTEAIGGVTTMYGYTYDLAGRLTGVMSNGVVIATYAYDSNGNRTSFTGPGGTITGIYDAQDRLLQYGTTTYGYTANGELLTKTIGAQTTNYQYDALGNLITVTLPNGTQIAYLIDGRNRRVGKQMNGTLTQGLLYDDQLRPAAQLDGSGSLASRFVYATRFNVPDYMIKNEVTYRLILDHLGSPRLVINVATGQIAQRIDYDEFGRVLLDTNPGFQPFGFAGGLYDPDTGLVRFGARDYDAETGRWTAKDPIAFNGGEENLYVYVVSDPLNWSDASGLTILPQNSAAGAAIKELKKNPTIGPKIQELEGKDFIIIIKEELGNDNAESKHTNHRKGEKCVSPIKYSLKNSQEAVKKYFNIDTTTLENVLAHELGHIYDSHFTDRSKRTDANNDAEAVRWENATRPGTEQRPRHQP